MEKNNLKITLTVVGIILPLVMIPIGYLVYLTHNLNSKINTSVENIEIAENAEETVELELASKLLEGYWSETSNPDENIFINFTEDQVSYFDLSNVQYLSGHYEYKNGQLILRPSTDPIIYDNVVIDENHFTATYEDIPLEFTKISKEEYEVADQNYDSLLNEIYAPTDPNESKTYNLMVGETAEFKDYSVRVEKVVYVIGDTPAGKQFGATLIINAKKKIKLNIYEDFLGYNVDLGTWETCVSVPLILSGGSEKKFSTYFDEIGTYNRVKWQDGNRIAYWDFNPDTIEVR